MAGNFGDTAVKTVNISVARLVETLKANLSKHKQDYAEAMDGYRNVQAEKLQTLQAATSRTVASNTKENREALQEAWDEYAHLDIPSNHSSSYEQAIALMDWEEREKIDLSINDFECYVRDNWTWAGSFKASHMNYSTSGRR